MPAHVSWLRTQRRSQGQPDWHTGSQVLPVPGNSGTHEANGPNLPEATVQAAGGATSVLGTAPLASGPVPFFQQCPGCVARPFLTQVKPSGQLSFCPQTSPPFWTFWVL
jgi:hypothetical protein